jgi:predicted transcriptional regulator
MCYRIRMDTITTIKVRRQTAKRLKVLAALQEDTMMYVLDRLVEQELARVKAEAERRRKASLDESHTGHTGVPDRA